MCYEIITMREWLCIYMLRGGGRGGGADYSILDFMMIFKSGTPHASLHIILKLMQVYLYQ